MHYLWPFFPTKAESSSCDRLHTKLKVFPNLFFFRHCCQSLWGDFIYLYDFSYFLAPGGRHMLAHISLHSLRLLLNPVFPVHQLIVGVHGQLLACGAQRTICRSSFPLPPRGFHELKEGQACEPSWQSFSLIFNLTNPLPHSMVSQKEYIASLNQTLFPFFCAQLKVWKSPPEAAFLVTLHPAISIS